MSSVENATALDVTKIGGGNHQNNEQNLSEIDLNDDEKPKMVEKSIENGDPASSPSKSLEFAPIVAVSASSTVAVAADQISISSSSKNVENSKSFDEIFANLNPENASNKEISDSIFNRLVGGIFDVEHKFIIENSIIVRKMVEFLDKCQPSLQAEIWSIFIGIARKSHKNLECCREISLISLILDRLSSCDLIVADLLIDLLSVLASYSVNVKEMKKFLHSLKTIEGYWPRHSAKLLYVLKQMPKRDGPDTFFTFNGAKKCGVQIPPLTKWPYQNGWTFATWFRIDPTSAANYELHIPYLYSFRTSKGLGYSCHFVGYCLVVTSLKTKTGKGYQLCVKYELQPRKWHHVVLSHVYGRWGRPNEVQCFVDGQHVETLDMAWHVNTSDHFDKCYIGYTYEEEKCSSFCGQMSAIYLFAEALNMQQAASLHNLGPNYQSSFKFENESETLPVGYAKFLFDGKLADSLVFAYCPKNCDRQLCLESSPKENNVNYFQHTPHALMLEGANVIHTHSIYSSLHSIGGIQMLLPLFNCLDTPQMEFGTNEQEVVDFTICSTLISVFAQLTQLSPSIRDQMTQTKAFLVIGNALCKASKRHIDDHVTDSLIQMSQYLINCPNGQHLLRHLFDHILFNPQLWIHAAPRLQIRLYTYLSNEFLAGCPQIYTNVRRVSTIMQMMHALKYYYWVENPLAKSGVKPRGLEGKRPSKDEILKIRSLILLFIRKLLLKHSDPTNLHNNAQSDDSATDTPVIMSISPISPGLHSSNKEDELQAMLNYLTSISEEENLYDVLKTVITLLSEDPAYLVPAFDKKKGLCTVFKLLSSKNESIRLSALKLFGYFLYRSTGKRKQDCLAPYNLFQLLVERLLNHSNGISFAIYNVLFEIMTESITLETILTRMNDPDKRLKFENPTLLKVIANLIVQSDQSKDDIHDIRQKFLSDILHLTVDSRENRRTILQMSVWQEWLINLSYVYTKNETEQAASKIVYRIFAVLLHHAVKLEFGGWRVWVDTLAIVHSKCSFEKFKLEMFEMNNCSARSKSIKIRRSKTGDDKKIVGNGFSTDQIVSDLISDMMNAICMDDYSRMSDDDDDYDTTMNRNPILPKPVYRTPEFRWSHVHVTMLSDLLTNIEADVNVWKNSTGVTLIDHANDSENAVFVVNTVHIISQLVDNLVMACGGLLPLLAAATSPNSELEIADSFQQMLPMQKAVHFLVRFANLIDVMVFATAVNFVEMEQEKNMPAGGILRQCLRLVCTLSVCNCLTAKYQPSLEILHKNYANFAKADLLLAALPDDKQTAKQKAIYCLMNGILHDDQDEKQMRSPSLIEDLEQLLQDADLNRIKAVIYRDVDESRQAQFLCLSSIYFLSVLMVSRYRDILEPPPSPSPFFGLGSPTASQTSTSSDGREESPQPAQPPLSYPDVDGRSSATAVSGAAAAGPKSPLTLAPGIEESAGVHKTSDIENSAARISSIRVSNGEKSENLDSIMSKTTDLPPISQNSNNNMATVIEVKDRQVGLTNKLKKALDSTAPFLRDIFTDFRSYLQKQLLGTHGQEIMNDQKVLNALFTKQTSVVELVMLLCSQEWQTSLQKHAGLAFIELVNEGRLLAQHTRDHVVRVANEADFILNRLHAEDVAKHTEFKNLCQQTARCRLDEETTCDMLITAARRRDNLSAYRIQDKILNILTSKHGAWSENRDKKDYRKLDVWEDDSRRRRRLVPNPIGSNHPEATLKAAAERGASELELEKVKEDLLLKRLPAGRSVVSSGLGGQQQGLEPSPDDALDLNKWASDEKEFELETSQESINFTSSAKLIAPGLVLPGILSISSTDMSFDCVEDDPEFKVHDMKVLRYCENLHGRWNLKEIRAIFLRRYMLQNTALEMFLSSRTAVMFAFDDFNIVKKVVQHLPRVGVGSKYGLPQSRKVSLMTPRQLFKHSDMPSKWQRREISNFDYLMFLNTIAGRTYNDLNQYPVFPWVLSNYDTEELDLKQPSNFRDLSKPIGALNDNRRAVFDERYRTWEHDKIPPFHYGTHYSTAAFTLSWLIRIEPFTTMFLQLQGGKFDHPDRTFHSLAESFLSCLRDTHDVKVDLVHTEFQLFEISTLYTFLKELIPEFFYLPEMFVNENRFNFGKRDDRVTVVDDVFLPKWAETPEHFVTVHRQALESDLVSCQLNQWIDLIFGYKQRGPEAVRATNVFYYLTYEGALDLTTVDDKVLKQALENQIKNFGQTPAQLLTEPHLPRQSIMTISPMIFQPITDDLCMVMKFISNSPVVHLSSNTYMQLQNPTVISITSNLVFALNHWNPTYVGPVVSPSSFNVTSPTQQNKETNQTPNLPLTVDPLLASGNPSIPVARRHLGDIFDQKCQIKWNNFVTTLDSKCILACGYPDYSFRVVDTENAKTRQVIYGHKATVTCLARSECNVAADFYVATGSLDCTVLLWHWSNKSQTITGDSSDAPCPKAVLTGHDTEIKCVIVSAEHGIVISSSKSCILIHTTNGDLLRSLEYCSDGDNFARSPSVPKSPSATAAHLLTLSRDCYVVAAFDDGCLRLFTTSGRLLKTTKLEAPFTCMTMTRDGEYLIAGSENGVVTVIRCINLKILYNYPPCDSPVRSIALAQNHRFILCGLSSGALVVFNVDFNKWHYGYQIRYGGRV